MIKNYKRDIGILIKIEMEIEKLQKSLNRFNIRSQRDIIEDEDVLDLCAFRVFQIGELSKRLTDETKNSLSFTSYISVSKLRDDIGHAYSSLNKSWLVSVVLKLITPEIRKEIQDRINYCKKNKKD